MLAHVKLGTAMAKLEELVKRLNAAWVRRQSRYLPLCCRELLCLIDLSCRRITCPTDISCKAGESQCDAVTQSFRRRPLPLLPAQRSC